MLAEGFSTPLGIAKTPDGKLIFDALGERAIFVMDYDFGDVEDGRIMPKDFFNGYFENNSDKYVVVRTEDDISVENGAGVCHNVILAPGDRYNGGIDGCMDSNGNFYKVTAKAPYTVSASIDSDGLFHIESFKSHFVNWGGDAMKKFGNLGLPKEKKYIFSGFYEKNSTGKDKENYDLLQRQWGESIVESFGTTQDDWKNNYDLQPKEIKDRITNRSRT